MDKFQVITMSGANYPFFFSIGILDISLQMLAKKKRDPHSVRIMAAVTVGIYL